MMTSKLRHYHQSTAKNAPRLLEDLPFLPQFPGDLGTENLENTTIHPVELDGNVISGSKNEYLIRKQYPINENSQKKQKTSLKINIECYQILINISKYTLSF